MKTNKNTTKKSMKAAMSKMTPMALKKHMATKHKAGKGNKMGY
jgi:hypothetical protein